MAHRLGTPSEFRGRGSPGMAHDGRWTLDGLTHQQEAQKVQDSGSPPQGVDVLADDSHGSPHVHQRNRLGTHWASGTGFLGQHEKKHGSHLFRRTQNHYTPLHTGGEYGPGTRGIIFRRKQTGKQSLSLTPIHTLAIPTSVHLRWSALDIIFYDPSEHVPILVFRQHSTDAFIHPSRGSESISQVIIGFPSAVANDAGIHEPAVHRKGAESLAQGGGSCYAGSIVILCSSSTYIYRTKHEADASRVRKDGKSGHGIRSLRYLGGSWAVLDQEM
ncbi:hypothetical protein B0H19DRAFT_1086515 [Mycena capillaripes]|nr:hypothetical protein B0H19DRAFT_1086515 [Mycena capillaripes]